jgi:hypothetical protein
MMDLPGQLTYRTEHIRRKVESAGARGTHRVIELKEREQSSMPALASDN